MDPEELKKLRVSCGLTQEGLAELVNVNATTVFRWEKGVVRPSIAKSRILEDFLVRSDGAKKPIVTELLSGISPRAVTNVMGCYVNCNSAFEKISGLIQSEIIGFPFWSEFPEILEEVEGHIPFEIVDLGTSNIEMITVKSKTCGKFETAATHSLDLLRQSHGSTVILHSITLLKEDKFTPGIRYLRRKA